MSKLLLSFIFPLVFIYWLVHWFYISTQVTNEGYFTTHSNAVNLLYQPCDGQTELSCALKQQREYSELYVFKTVYRLNHPNHCQPKSFIKKSFIGKSIIA